MREYECEIIINHQNLLKMKELDKNKQDPTNVFEKLGHAFIKIPRRIMSPLFYGTVNDRKLAMLYLTLFYHCAFKEETVTFAKKFVRCQKGQWIGSMEQLAELTASKRDHVRYLLEKLNKDKRICVEKIFRGMRITVLGYAEFTESGGKEKTETPEERIAREYCEMIDKLNKGRY